MWEGGKFGKARLRHRFAQALLGNGLLGGYTVYDNHVNVRLLSLDSSRKLTKFLSAEGMMSAEKGRNVLLAASFDMQKLVWANAKTGTVWVHVTEQSGQRSGTTGASGGDGRGGLVRGVQQARRVRIVRRGFTDGWRERHPHRDPGDGERRR